MLLSSHLLPKAFGKINTKRCIMRIPQMGIFYFNLTDWTWWIWLVTAICLGVGLMGIPAGFIAAMGLTSTQVIVFLVKDRSLRAFSVQLRIGYLALLVLCFIPAMRWLYWLPTVGTFALVIFGYCLMARFLSLLPWNSTEAYTMSRLRRTFFSPPDISRVERGIPEGGCAGGLCTIEAQVAPKTQTAEPGA